MKILETTKTQSKETIAIVVSKISLIMNAGKEGTTVYLAGDDTPVVISSPYKEVLAILSEDDRVEITGDPKPELNVCRHLRILSSESTMDKTCADCGAILAR